MPISIALVSDVRSFLKGTGDVEGALDDVSDSLDDLTRDAHRKTDQIGDDLERVGDEGADAAKHLERKMRESFDDTRKAAKRATDDVADDTRRNMGRAGDAVGEFKSEAIQNVAETASSFDGSMDSIADMVQGTLGGLAMLPGVGIGIAALGALGGAVLASWTGTAEGVEERVQTMFDNMLESGLNYLTESQIQEALKALYDDDGKMDDVRRAAETLGLSVETVAAAYVTAGTARDTVQARALEAIAAEQAAIDTLRANVSNTSRAAQEATGHEIIAREAVIAGYQNVLTMMARQAEEQDSAAAGVESFRRATVAAMLSHRQAYGDAAQDLAGYSRTMDEARARWESAPAPVITPTLDMTVAERQLARWRPQVTADVRARSGGPV